MIQKSDNTAPIVHFCDPSRAIPAPHRGRAAPELAAAPSRVRPLWHNPSVESPPALRVASVPKRLPLAALDPLAAAALAAFAAFVALAVSVPRSAVAAAPAAHAPVAVQIDNAWIPEPPPDTHVAAAYFTISNIGHGPAVLIGVRCPLASSAMLHRTMVMHGESMMRPIERLAIAPTQVVTLRPDGMHVMLDGLRSPLVVGERVPLVLLFEGGQDVHLTATVRRIGGD
jgi:periplasmic copper chaperone A